MFLLLVTLVSSQKLQSLTDCVGSNDYYNSASMTCTACPTNTKRYNQTWCVCDNVNSQFNSYDIIGFQSSLSCVTNTSKCIDSSYVKLKYSKNGAISSGACTQCTNGYPDMNYVSCIPCGHPQMVNSTCVCNTNYTATKGTCVSSDDTTAYEAGLADSQSILFNAIEVSSNYLGFNYYYALIGCEKYTSIDACQLLANLCVFKMYNLDDLLCKTYLAKQKTSTTISQIYYTDDPIAVYSDTSFGKTMTLDRLQADVLQYYLPYYLFVYSIDGVLLRQVQLTNELMLCPHTKGDVLNSKAFGLNIKIECTINLQPYLTDYTTYLYELYLQSDTTEYLPVPILIDNYQLGTSTPNQGGAASQYQFVRRFFIVDIIGGKDNNYDNPLTFPKAIRYPKSVQFIIRPQDFSIEKIYVPYVHIEYGTSLVVDNVAESVDISFVVINKYEPSNYWNITLILFIVCNILVIIAWLIKIYVWTRANPSSSMGTQYQLILFMNIIKSLFHTWNDAMFYFLFLMTGYWFVFFKFQNTPFILLLDQNDYTNYQPFDALFYTIFVIKMFLAIELIYQQSNISIYFVDWERTEFQRPTEMEADGEELRKQADRIKSRVSVWRTLLVANEFNELQVSRSVSLNWTLMLMGFFMMGLNIEERAQESPDLIDTYSNVPSNYVLKYFLVQFIYICVGSAQLILRRIFNIWVPYPHEDFTDLCTIANISIFILDDHLHGYYIHGENPFGFSEGSIEHMQACLRNEAKMKGKQRGLLKEGQDGELQTFELFVPPKFKKQFETAYDSLRNYKEKNDIKQLGIEMVEVQKYQLDQFLKSRINEIRKSDKQVAYVRSKEPAQRFFDYPPDEISRPEFNNMTLPFFFKDPDMTYKNVFFSGHETFFLLTDILLFNFWLIVTDIMPLAILLQYFCSKSLEWLKLAWAQDNISDKTKIDKRFLI